ncbi:MAG: TIGR00730 family Rossman fold protein [Planctomycetota bacterium]|nr:TIGR00730 family Rossman fold protein [Planctomycetota bacterium]
MARVCVFCGSAPGSRPAYGAAACELGTLLGERGVELVWGGGNVGLMGIVADATLAAGGRAIGVIPAALADRELGHARASELHVVRTMHERKALMADLSDAFIALPGGMGTLDELFEILTWAQLGFHAKPVGLLDVEGYYAPLLAFLDRARDEGFVRPGDRANLLVDTDVTSLVDRLARGPVPLRR